MIAVAFVRHPGFMSWTFLFQGSAMAHDDQSLICFLALSASMDTCEEGYSVCQLLQAASPYFKNGRVCKLSLSHMGNDTCTA